MYQLWARNGLGAKGYRDKDDRREDQTKLLHPHDDFTEQSVCGRKSRRVERVAGRVEAPCFTGRDRKSVVEGLHIRAPRSRSPEWLWRFSEF